MDKKIKVGKVLEKQEKSQNSRKSLKIVGKSLRIVEKVLEKQEEFNEYQSRENML